MDMDRVQIPNDLDISGEIRPRMRIVIIQEDTPHGAGWRERRVSPTPEEAEAEFQYCLALAKELDARLMALTEFTEGHYARWYTKDAMSSACVVYTMLKRAYELRDWPMRSGGATQVTPIEPPPQMPIAQAGEVPK